MNLFYPMLVTGLLTSFHCVMMCGNMVLSYAVKGSEEGPLLQRMKPHFAYHGSKILSYTLVGLLLGSIGSFISQGARSWVSVIAGVYMVLLGLQMTGKFPQLNRIQPRPPRFIMTGLQKLRRKANADASQGESTLATPVSFGLMTGLMPCGPLIAAQVAAAGSGSTFAGGLAMLGFGLGTAPLMLGYGAVASYLGARFKQYMNVAAAILIVVLGLVMVNRGATALGSPVNFNVIKQAVVGTGPVAVDESQFKTGADGVVEVPFSVAGSTYSPNPLVIPADKPVRLIVTRSDANACSKQLAIPNLGILVDLKDNGVTNVDLPASKTGTYQLTCGMGMLSGQLQVGAGAARSGYGFNFPMIILVILGAAGLAVNGYSRKQRQAEEERRARRQPKGHGSGRHAGPAPVPQPVGLFGLAPVETVLVASSILLAIVAGLTLGGFFA